MWLLHRFPSSPGIRTSRYQSDSITPLTTRPKTCLSSTRHNLCPSQQLLHLITLSANHSRGGAPKRLPIVFCATLKHLQAKREEIPTLRKRDYLKYGTTVKGCPSLTQCHSLLRPWWMGSEGHQFSFFVS